jgi:hypothetical protein
LLGKTEKVTGRNASPCGKEGLGKGRLEAPALPLASLHDKFSANLQISARTSLFKEAFLISILGNQFTLAPFFHSIFTIVISQLLMVKLVS